MKMGNKKGSHVGVIASFAIFVMFLVAVLLIFEPSLTTQKNKKAILEYVQTEIEKNTSGNLTTAIVFSSGGCLNVDNSFAGVEDGLDAVVKDQDKNNVDSQYSGTILTIEDSSSDVLWIYYADVNFTDSSTSASGCAVPQIRSVRRNTHFFEQKIVDTIENYAAIKPALNVPPGSDFSISFTYSNNTVISAGEKNITSEAYSEDIPIQYVDKNANALSGKLTIRVW